MSATAADRFEMYPRFNARHGIGAVVLIALLIVLPIFGLGPMDWQQHLRSAEEPRPTTPATSDSSAVPVDGSKAQGAAATSESQTPRAETKSRPALATAPRDTASVEKAASDPAADSATRLATAGTSPAVIAGSSPPLPADPTRDADNARKAVEAKPRAVLYFGFDSDNIRADSRRRLEPVVAYLQAHPDARVQIAGFHDTRGVRIYNEDLARRRAAAVGAALESLGVARHRVVIAKPARSTGGGNPDEARRTEVTIVR